MNCIFSSRNAVYDESTKKYTFNFRSALSNVRTFTIKECSFVLENHNVSPAHVFLRCNQILDNAESGSFREARSGITDGLNHHTSVVAMLVENSQKFRYHLKLPVTFRLRKNCFIEALSFFFTDDSGQILDMRAQSGNLNSPVSDATIDELQDLVFWTDFSAPNKLLDINNSPVPAEANQNVNYILDRKRPTLSFALAYGTHCSTCLIGQTIGITRGENQSWQSFFDGSAWNDGEGTLQDQFHFHMLVNLPDISAFCNLVVSEFLYLVVYQNALVVVKNGNDYNGVLNLQVLQNVPYIISLQRVQQGNNWNFDVTLQPALEDVNQQGTQTASVEATSQQILDDEQWNNVRIGAPNTHFSQQTSHMLLCNGSSTDDFDKCIAWIKAKAGGTEVGEPETGTESHFSLFATIQ